MFRATQTYPTYSPEYSRDPRFIGDPRYYGRGPQQRYPYGYPEASRGPGNGALIAGCAIFVVILVVAVIGGLAVGLVFGLSGNSSTGNAAMNAPVIPVVSSTQAPGVVPSVNPNDVVAVDTTMDTTVAFNQGFSDTSSSSFRALQSLVLPPIDESFASSDLAALYQGSELISTENINGGTRIVVRLRFFARPPLVTTDENTVLSSSVILADRVVSTDAADGNIQNSFNVVSSSVQSVSAGINVPVQIPGGSADSLSITCPENILTFVNPGESSRAVSWTMATVTGATGSITYTESHPSNSVFPLGVTVVTINAVDTVASVSCTFVVEVAVSGDASNSFSVTCPGDVVAFAGQDQSSVAVTWDPPVTSNANGPVTVQYSRQMNSLFPLGTTVVVVTAADSTTAIQCNFDVTVQAGTSAFMIICPNDRIVGTRQGEAFAILNFDPPQIIGQTNGPVTITYEPPETTLYQIGTTAVVVTVEDSNSALSCTFDVTVRDMELPVLVCDTGGEVNTDPGQDYATISWTTPTASDNMDNALQVVVSRQPGQFTVGTHTVTASATDSSDNTGTCSWTYVVRDMEPPVVTCPSSFTVRIPSTHTSAVVDYENLVSASDNVAIGVTVNVSPSDIYPFEAGVYNPVATATDSSGNIHQCTFQLTVSDSCGKTGTTLSPRIIGGTDAAAGTFPWMASLSLGTHFCGSVIINENWVITATHCDITLTTNVIAGDVTLPTVSPNRQSRTVVQIIGHPSYQVNRTPYDIALVRLSSPLVMTDYVQSACLTTEGEEADLFGSSVCRVAGWGTVVADDTAPASDTLKETTLNVYTQAECEDIYNNNIQLSFVNICAGLPAGGSDACFGDSGGGLVCPDINNFWHVVGLVSAGRGCGEPNSPGIYARTSQFNDFIYAYLGAELVVVEPLQDATFSSQPSGTVQYSNNVIKGWRFRRFGGIGIRLNFAEFELATGDTLTVGHGLNPWDSSTILDVLTSVFVAPSLDYNGHTDLWFRFASDSSVTAPGFLVRVSVIA